MNRTVAALSVSPELQVQAKLEVGVILVAIQFDQERHQVEIKPSFFMSTLDLSL